MASGSVTQTAVQNIDETFVAITLAWTADTGGALDATALNASMKALAFGKYLIQAITVPGGRAPSSNYDITITDENGIDLMGGKMENRHTSNAEAAMPLYFSRPVYGSLTLNLSGNSVDRATGAVILQFSKYPVTTGLTS